MFQRANRAQPPAPSGHSELEGLRLRSAWGRRPKQGCKVPAACLRLPWASGPLGPQGFSPAPREVPSRGPFMTPATPPPCGETSGPAFLPQGNQPGPRGFTGSWTHPARLFLAALAWVCNDDAALGGCLGTRRSLTSPCTRREPAPACSTLSQRPFPKRGVAVRGGGDRRGDARGAPWHLLVPLQWVTQMLFCP